MPSGGARFGARPGSGRKPKWVELELQEDIEHSFTKDKRKELFSVLLERGIGGSVPHAELLLKYYYGKPRESIKIEADINNNQNLNINLSALSSSDLVQLYELAARTISLPDTEQTPDTGGTLPT